MILFISAIFFIAISLWVFDIRRMTKKDLKIKSLQFTLFALRDRVIRLVADGKVPNDDECFKFVYYIINGGIINIKEFNFKNVLRAAKTADKEMRPRISDLIQKVFADNELRIILIEYLDVLIEALVVNSVSVRTYLWFKIRFFRKVSDDSRSKKLSKFKILQKPVEPYLVQKDLVGYRERLAVAA